MAMNKELFELQIEKIKLSESPDYTGKEEILDKVFNWKQSCLNGAVLQFDDLIQLPNTLLGCTGNNRKNIMSENDLHKPTLAWYEDILISVFGDVLDDKHINIKSILDNFRFFINRLPGNGKVTYRGHDSVSVEIPFQFEKYSFAREAMSNSAISKEKTFDEIFIGRLNKALEEAKKDIDKVNVKIIDFNRNKVAQFPNEERRNKKATDLLHDLSHSLQEAKFCDLLLSNEDLRKQYFNDGENVNWEKLFDKSVFSEEQAINDPEHTGIFKNFINHLAPRGYIKDQASANTDQVMYAIIRAKFLGNSKLCQLAILLGAALKEGKLLAIIEAIEHFDKAWGVVYSEENSAKVLPLSILGQNDVINIEGKAGQGKLGYMLELVCREAYGFYLEITQNNNEKEFSWLFSEENTFHPERSVIKGEDLIANVPGQLNDVIGGYNKIPQEQVGCGHAAAATRQVEVATLVAFEGARASEIENYVDPRVNADDADNSEENERAHKHYSLS